MHRKFYERIAEIFITKHDEEGYNKANEYVQRTVSSDIQKEQLAIDIVKQSENKTKDNK